MSASMPWPKKTSEEGSAAVRSCRQRQTLSCSLRGRASDGSRRSWQHTGRASTSFSLVCLLSVDYIKTHDPPSPLHWSMMPDHVWTLSPPAVLPCPVH